MNIQLSENSNKKVITVQFDRPIAEAFEFMKESRVRHLVVVNEEKQVLGVISDRDFQRAMQTKVENRGFIKMIEESFNLNHSVQDFMSWGSQTIHESFGLKQAALKMLESKISSLIIIDDNNKMVGFLTTDDLLWALIKLSEEENAESLLLDLKAQIVNSPIGTIVSGFSQMGI